MGSVLLVHAAATWALVGLIWTVQLVLYPLFARVDPAAFPAYHEAHVRRITFVVAPLMLLEAATALALLVRPPEGTCPPLPWVACALLVVVWVSTAGLQVPCHRRLEAGFDAAAHRTLVRTNWIRTAAWTLRGGLVLLWCLRVL